jgi:hypothetical protein
MRASIHQPNYLPYLGYFHKIKNADLFVVYDVAQYVRDRFDNRNRIKGANGPVWLTVPLRVEHAFQKRFFEIPLPPEDHWKRKHLRTIETEYRRAAHLARYLPAIRQIYEAQHATLADLSTALIRFQMDALGISTPVVKATSLGLDLSLKSTEMLIAILRAVGADGYLAGPSGPKYMDMDLMARSGIRVDIQEFRHPVYRQLHGDFAPGLAALDLLLNEGEDSGKIL